MPELPEVESTRRHLAPVLEGRRIVGVSVRRDRMVRHHERPGDFADRLTGRSVLSLGRVGKLLRASLDGDLTWVVHLGMSGRMAIHRTDDPEAPHTNVVIRVGDGTEVRMVDPRTFGFTAVFTPEEMRTGVGSRWGPDALDDLPKTRRLADSLQGRSAPIKALLLDQRLVAGLGNIYADEVLFRARIRPGRAGGSLTADEVGRLRAAVRPVLQAGLRHGGTSLDDLAYLLPDGRAGDYLRRLRVYGRAGERCRRCGGTVERSVIRSRSTFWCAGCQR
ncbi:MAG TPA: bifunctional DNA-formamidopyrimidine glycosylase/DNA-(apurinic or apyrimidinic site) lyase [Acidimicrobiia bacterium]|nr:bifunctional DNA-formamidopyrimidine glycosylase/DNA-(apurinic or apyrimidinic site) lyase [Acidimicrobiia bacterium]